jgi:hypothetical protein
MLYPTATLLSVCYGRVALVKAPHPIPSPQERGNRHNLGYKDERNKVQGARFGVKGKR